jgi:hypothetical protein
MDFFRNLIDDIHSIHSDINHSKGVIPAKAGNYHLGAWIPPYQVRGRLSQARNDRLRQTYVVMYN